MRLPVRGWLLAALGIGLLSDPVGRDGLVPVAGAGAKKDAAKKETPDKQDEELKQKVKKLFEDGMVQYDLRRFDVAITLFEKAFETRPDPVFLYNIAQAHRMAGDLPGGCLLPQLLAQGSRCAERRGCEGLDCSA